MYETFDHTADVGLRVRAPDLNQLFADAGQGLFSLLVADLATVRCAQSMAFAATASSYDDLLFDWLAELLFTFDTERVLLREFEVQVEGFALKATAHGEPLDPRRHELDMEVKAVTYHGLKVERTDDGWLAEVILDL
ncbi:MAG TPA: archease [Planctomycetes bacterium]|nr:archease [Planctomycetota bacterium]